MNNNDNDIFSSSNNEPDENNYEDILSDSLGEKQESQNSLDLNSFSSEAVNEARIMRTKKKRSKELYLKMLLTVVLVGIITVSVVAGTFIIYAFTAIDGTVEQDLNDLELYFTTTIYVQDDNSEWTEYQRLHGEFNRIWMPYDNIAANDKDNTEYDGIPQNLVDAFVAVEDKRFYKHYGVDWRRTVYSFANMFLNFDDRQGGSTITQQLVKNLTGDKSQKASRKVREIMRARYLESNYSKDTIIECYLNTIAMGHGIYGVEVAANYYFGKSVDELTLLECASLASITKNPLNYAPDDEPENNKERRETVLALMLQQGLITEEERDAALKEEFNLIASREHLNENEVNNYFVDALIVQVTNDLAKKYGWTTEEAATEFYNGGYKIYSTLNPEAQSTVDSVFSNSDTYGLKGKDSQQLQGAITVMDYKGRVIALSGGIGEKTVNLGMSGFNRATDAVRQPGSTMKPIAAYAPAIESNTINYSTILNDTATKYRDWTPKNWYGGYLGGVTTQYALERSINTIPVYLVNKLTPQHCYDFLCDSLGVTTLNKNDIDLSPLGMGGTNGGITTMESAAAYQVFGNGGLYYEPTLYYAVYDQHDEVVLSYEKPEPVVAISEDTATVMNHLLRTVVYGGSGTGKGAAGYIPNMKIYAKTGTSNNSNDLWFVGGTPYYIASCWCGYDTPQAVSDSGIARKMWGAVMSQIHNGIEVKEFVDSSYASELYYCTQTGLLATDACPSKAVGWYRKNGMPSICTAHEGTALDSPAAEAAKLEAAQNESEAAGAESTDETQTSE